MSFGARTNDAGKSNQTIAGVLVTLDINMHKI